MGGLAAQAPRLLVQNLTGGNGLGAAAATAPSLLLIGYKEVLLFPCRRRVIGQLNLQRRRLRGENTRR